MPAILVLGETRDTGLHPFTLEALTLARSLGAEKSMDVALSVVADDAGSLPAQAGEYGAKTLHLLKGISSYSEKSVVTGLKNLLSSGEFPYVISGTTARSKEIMPQLAVIMDAHLITEVMSVAVEGAGLEVKRPLFTGKVIQTLAVNADKVLLSLKPKQIEASAAGGSAAAVETHDVTVSDPASVLQDILKEAAGKIDLQSAEVIVSGGRGMGGPDNWHLIEAFADAMGAAKGASRAVVDAGWRPHSEQVGQTGKIVSPKLYFAVGISGAIQHLVGMQNSKYIVAINKDAEAPIFKKADYGLVGDALTILPKLTEAVSASKNGA